MRVTLISIDMKRAIVRRYACGVTNSKIAPMLTHDGTVTLNDPELPMCIQYFRDFPPEEMKVA